MNTMGIVLKLYLLIAQTKSHWLSCICQSQLVSMNITKGKALHFQTRNAAKIEGTASNFYKMTATKNMGVAGGSDKIVKRVCAQVWMQRYCIRKNSSTSFTY